MKLRNRKTGEIVEFRYLQSDHVAPLVLTTYENDKPEMYTYNSLAELEREWEDYEEPEGYWWISPVCADAVHCAKDAGDETDEYNKEIGNYFSSREEAENAVEKLKAWKRLKDKGFRFTLTSGVGSLDITPGKFQIEINADMPAKWFCCDAVQEDLNLLFSGGEE